MVVVTPVGNLFIDLYWGAFSLGQNGESGPFVALAAMTIFTVILISLMHKIFSLIHVIPDQILQWMGGPSGNLGQTANQLGEAGGRNAAAVGGVVGGLAGHMTSGLNSKRQIDAARDGAKAQREGNFQNNERALGQGMGAAEAAASKKPWGKPGFMDSRADQQNRREKAYNAQMAEKGIGAGVDKDNNPQSAFERREDFANRMAERGHAGLGGADYDQMQHAFKSVTEKGGAFDMEKYADAVTSRKNGGNAGSTTNNSEPTTGPIAQNNGGEGGGTTQKPPIE
ncbi:MAG: hypothetical protein LBE81_04480, partial [Azonexus sp.]|jgi:hypothetical protein|uniref:hypothetical protein n=1 Tax=Azonexus sp. TaxID=1872668 RepID=UPI0028348DB6